MKGTKSNKMNSQIEESSDKNKTEQDICNKENDNTLEKTQFDNNIEENISQINVHDKDKIKIKKIVQKIKK